MHECITYTSTLSTRYIDTGTDKLGLLTRGTGIEKDNRNLNIYEIGSHDWIFFLQYHSLVSQDHIEVDYQYRCSSVTCEEI